MSAAAKRRHESIKSSAIAPAERNAKRLSSKVTLSRTAGEIDRIEAT
jgi:hypothetical protein